jgi:hypothetical protein
VQRTTYKTGQLAADRIAQLEALPGWGWDVKADQWEEGFRNLRRFVDREGHARVPLSRVEDRYRLGDWVGTQRTTYKAGEITADRVARLEALPGWVWKVELWEEGFDHLCRFVDSEGHARVPSGLLEDGYRLGQWVTVQRRTHKTGKLESARVARLETLPGWTWEPVADQWEEGFRYLYRFAERERHSRVPQKHLEDGYRLGQWVTVQRTMYKTGQIPADRVARLEALPGWSWNPRKEG